MKARESGLAIKFRVWVSFKISKVQTKFFFPQRAEEPLLGMLGLVLDCSKKVSGNSKCLSWFPEYGKNVLLCGTIGSLG